MTPTQLRELAERLERPYADADPDGLLDEAAAALRALAGEPSPSPTLSPPLENRMSTTTLEAVAFADLPALKQPLAGGTFCGLTTRADGVHCAVVLLDAKSDKRLAWKAAGAWAKKAGGELPTRPVAALLYAVAKDLFEPNWYWTADEDEDASFAWGCYFDGGYQYCDDKGYEGRAVAVRMIPLAA